jgi:hypothetical protein
MEQFPLLHELLKQQEETMVDWCAIGPTIRDWFHFLRLL